MYFVRKYKVEDREIWDRFVEESKNGTFLFKRAYMDYHSDRFRDFSTIAHDDRGNLVALFPANQDEARLASHSGLSYGGMVADEAMTTSRALDVFDAWIAYCRSSGIDEITYKTIPSIYHSVPAEEDKYALFYYGAELYRRDILSVVDLAHRLSPQARRCRGKNKAAEMGLRVRESPSLTNYWDILSENLLRRHAQRPVHTLAEIQLLQSRFPKNIRLFGVFDGDKMCAGTLLYQSRQAVHAQYIASNEEARASGALDLLFLSLIEMFQGRLRYFDFGNSNLDDGLFLNRGLADFKEGFGARTICHDFYRLDLRRPRTSEKPI